jgi:hypothetical protein
VRAAPVPRRVSPRINWDALELAHPGCYVLVVEDGNTGARCSIGYPMDEDGGNDIWHRSVHTFTRGRDE